MADEMKYEWEEWCAFNEANSHWWEPIDMQADEQCMNEDEV